MKIEHKIVKSSLYVALRGELDCVNAAYVREELDRLSNSDITRVIVDLSALEFMDSTGIGVLLGRYKRLKPKNIPIYLASPLPAVDKVLRLSGIYDIMPKFCS